jgi:phosphatidylserine decarboxylase
VPIDPAGWPFIGGALAVALAWTMAGAWLVAAPFFLLAGFFLFFFRDPNRLSPSDDDAVLSPADGRVLVAGPAVADSTPP